VERSGAGQGEPQGEVARRGHLGRAPVGRLGTTAVFTDYLAKVSPNGRRARRGQERELATGLGGKGNEGVTGTVKTTEGGIGYVELAYANQNKLSMAELRNKDGSWVKPSLETVSAAAPRPRSRRLPRLDHRRARQGRLADLGLHLAPCLQDQTDPRKGEALVHFSVGRARRTEARRRARLRAAPRPLVKRVEGTLESITVQGKAVLATRK